MTAFSKGQLVKANFTAQGMTKGNTYKVIDLESLYMPFGTIVTYLIEDKDGTKLLIGNGHLLLSAAN